MIPLTPREHRASYDGDGNIILPPDATSVHAQPQQRPSTNAEVSAVWTLVEPPSPEDIFDPVSTAASSEPTDIHHPSLANHVSSVRRTITRDVLEEGLRQYRESLAGAAPLLQSFDEGSRSLLRSFLDMLAQPVHLTRKGNRVRETSRGTLFFTDILRFGGTFAMIFLALFVSLNYQSFWEIARSKVGPFLSSPVIGSRADPLAAKLQDSLKLLPSLAHAGGTEGDLLSVLPEVGPPDNRIVIPKLDLNVPLVNPPYQALLKGDWTQVEQDIQTALQDGVVHYPGTANPGQAGNFFVTGHSSYYPWAPGSYKTVFARLQDLDLGDEFWVYYGGDKFRYIVRSKKEVSPSDVTVLDQPTDERISTLMTCTPVGTSLRRLIVIANEVDPETGIPLKVGERATQTAPSFNLEALPI